MRHCGTEGAPEWLGRAATPAPRPSGLKLDADAGTGGEMDTWLCRGWVAFDPHTLFPGRMEEALQFFCEWAFTVGEAIPGSKDLVVDEVWRYCNPQKLPPELANVVQSGRKAGMQLLVNTQEPSRLSGPIVNGMSEMVCFRLQSGAALDWAEFYGADPLEVQTLNVLSFVSRNCASGGVLRGRIKV
jgi:hypothetical protein